MFEAKPVLENPDMLVAPGVTFENDIEQQTKTRNRAGRWVNPWRSLCLLLAAIALAAPPNRAIASDPTPVSVTLAWDAVPGAEISGYNLYYGASSGNYTNFVSTSATQVQVTNLVSSTRYYFAATALDRAGLESPFSAEISAVVGAPPPPARLSPALSAAAQFNLGGTAPPGYQYEVLATSDLGVWTTIGTVTADSTGAIQFTDPTPPTNSWRFYQLRQLAP